MRSNVFSSLQWLDMEFHWVKLAYTSKVIFDRGLTHVSMIPFFKPLLFSLRSAIHQLSNLQTFQRSNSRREHRDFNLPLRQLHHLNGFLC